MSNSLNGFKMSKFWIKVSFWENVKRTLAIFAAPATGVLHLADSPDIWVYLTGGISFVGALLAIWATDNNKNGIVDIFEE